MSAASNTVNDIWLDTAARIGSRIIGNALWDGDVCTWNVWTSQAIPGVRKGHWMPAGSPLYQGTAGTALFLSELYRHTLDQRFLVTARGALRHAEQGGHASPPSSSGFHSGRVGIAYALYQHALISGQAELMTNAEALLRPLIDSAHRNTSSDVIGGSAGAIPPLLQMAAHLPADVTTNLAQAMGDQLISSARRQRIGWSWGGIPTAVSDLNGYSHGASGYAHAFLELYAVTGDSWYRHAAEQAMAYEATGYDAERENWPDWRHFELSEYTAAGSYAPLRAKLKAGSTMPPYVKAFPIMWCHGAPGIGLARLRAYEVLHEIVYQQEALVAAKTTRASVRSESGMNYSLCHGFLGNCETLLAGTAVLGNAELRVAAEERASIGRERFEMAGQPWPCGTVESVADSSLLVGEAGIGYFFLRLHDDTTPSILCVKPGQTASAIPSRERDPNTLRRQHIDGFFQTTIAAFERLQPHKPSLYETDSGAPNQLIPRIFHSIRSRIGNEPDQKKKSLLVDAFGVDRTHYEFEAAYFDRSAAFIANLVRPLPQEIHWETAVFQLSQHATLVDSSRDWLQWAHSDAPLVQTDDEQVTNAVFRSSGDVQVRPLSPFTAAVLSCTREPLTVSLVTERVVQRIEGATVAQLAAPVLEQIKAAYAIGLLECKSLRSADAESAAA